LFPFFYFKKVGKNIPTFCWSVYSNIYFYILVIGQNFLTRNLD